jgi:hypothetical protein
MVNTEPESMSAGDKLNALVMGLASSSLRLLSKGSFEAQCGRCLQCSLPVDAVCSEHAWSELLKDGWTWHVSPAGDTGYASCIECLKAGAKPLTD